MKRIMNPRTAVSTLARANKRLAEIETALVELRTERDKVNQLRAALFGQLDLPMPPAEAPTKPSDALLGGVEEIDPFWDTKTGEHTTPEFDLGQIEVTRNLLVESGDCFWAIGAHPHKMVGNNWVCLAPEEQRREPCLTAFGSLSTT